MESTLIAIAALVAAMVSIQGGAAFVKGLIPAIGGGGAIALRLFFAALMLAMVRRPWRGEAMSPRLWRAVIAYGVSLGAMNFLFYQALGRIPLGIAVALEFTGPLLLAVGLSRRWRDGLWVGLAALGVALLLPKMGISGDDASLTQALDPVGVLFALAAGAFWAGYIVFGRRVGLLIPSGQASAWGMIVAALVFAPLGSWTAPHDLWSWKYLPVGAAIGFFSSALPYSLEMYALKRVPTRSFGILMSLEPAVAALFGMMVLRERLDWTQTLAIAAIVMASFGTAMTSRGAEPK